LLAKLLSIIDYAFFSTTHVLGFVLATVYYGGNGAISTPSQAQTHLTALVICNRKCAPEKLPAVYVSRGLSKKAPTDKVLLIGEYFDISRTKGLSWTS
ncbi:hypothetical protein RvY_17728, partial [Ramazzottius varieornatus]